MNTADIYSQSIRFTEEAKPTWRRMLAVGDVLASGVELPPLGDLEVKDLKNAEEETARPLGGGGNGKKT